MKLKVNDMTTYQYAESVFGNSWQRNTKTTKTKPVLIKYVSPKIIIGLMNGEDVEFRPRKNGKWMKTGDWSGDARRFDHLGIEPEVLSKDEILEMAENRITGIHPDKLNSGDSRQECSEKGEVRVFQQYCNANGIEWNDFLTNAFKAREATWSKYMSDQVDTHMSRLKRNNDRLAEYKRNLIHIDNTGEYDKGSFESVADQREWIRDRIEEYQNTVTYQQQKVDGYQRLLDKGYPRVIDHARTWYDKVA